MSQPSTAGRALSRAELRSEKFDRVTFLGLRRRPITVVLDGVRQKYNIGAIFRLCDAFLIEHLYICGTDIDMRSRKLVQAARGTLWWVPSTTAPSAVPIVAAAKTAGAWILAAEQTTTSIVPSGVTPEAPTVLVLGAETDGVSQEVLDLADVTVAIPMAGMANSLNVSTAAAILLYELTVRDGSRLRS